jgi:predicted nucleic acid-binding protein
LTLIVDSSVALKWFLPGEPDAGRALDILRNGERLIAPDLLIAEVCNASWKAVRLGRISQLQADQIAADLPQLFAAFVSMAPLAPRAVAIAAVLDHPVYDAMYLALAEHEQAKAVTADSRLIGKVQNTVWESHVTFLANY